MRPLDDDRRRLPAILDATADAAKSFLADLDSRPVVQTPPAIEPLGLLDDGLGADVARRDLLARYGPWLSGSAGPRYFAFVTGGATPAALAGDWLTGAFDQNAVDAGTSSAQALALDALGMMRQLLGLPEHFGGVFVTGATVSNFAGLAAARQWLGERRGVDVAEQGVAALGPATVHAGTAHSSVLKALSMAGLGRSALQPVTTLEGREAIDLDALEAALDAADGPTIVVAAAGTVNTCDFDDLGALGRLKERYDFWLHVDGAFGALAAASPRFAHLVAGLEHADSITVDAHKWLNVPYDGALLLTPRRDLLGAVFRNAASYIGTEIRDDTFVHLTPENSQRLRALPIWSTLAAYGRRGHAEIIERCCDLAASLGRRLDADPRFRLLAPVRLNGLCFTVSSEGSQEPTLDDIAAFLARLRDDGTIYLTPTVYRGLPAARVSITNWRTDEADIEAAWEALQRCVRV
ncbi:MAG: pyridoxal-dependent decarboxylase [Acidobacteriota bacterium]